MVDGQTKISKNQGADGMARIMELGTAMGGDLGDRLELGALVIEARSFIYMELDENIQVEVRGIHVQGMGGVLYPGDTNFKTRKPVMDILREEHPYLLTPDLFNQACTSIE